MELKLKFMEEIYIDSDGHSNVMSGITDVDSTETGQIHVESRWSGRCSD